MSESYAYGRVIFDLEGSRILLLGEAGGAGTTIGRDSMDQKDAKGEFRIKNPKIRETPYST